MSSRFTKNVILCFFFVLKILVQYLLVNPVYDLHRDEYLHLDQARHLAWGYESVPPFTSWISWLIWQAGNDVFWVHFFPALFGALTMLVVWKAIEALHGGLFALIMGATAVTFSVLLRINMLYQPNSLDILCWTLLYFALLKYIISWNGKWLWAAAAFFAIGFLNKYNILFLVVGLFPALLLTHHRKIFRDKNFYIAVLLAFLLTAPNLVWQYNNHFPVLRHMNTLAATQLVNVKRSDFLTEQVLFFFNSVFVLLAAFVAMVFYPPFRRYRIFGFSFIFTLLVFVYLKAKGYYSIGLYPILLAFGAVYLETVLANGWLRWLRALAIAIPLLLFIPALKIAFPIDPPEVIAARGESLKKLGQLRWEDGRDHQLPQDFADMLGWRELAQKTDLAFDSIVDKEHTLVLCDNYGQAGAINYYSKHNAVGAVSMNADYKNWFPLERPLRNVILIKEAADTSRDRERRLFRRYTSAAASKIILRGNMALRSTSWKVQQLTSTGFCNRRFLNENPHHSAATAVVMTRTKKWPQRPFGFI